MRTEATDTRSLQFQDPIASVVVSAQNIWNVVLDIEDEGRLAHIFVGCNVANETLEIEVTIDGIELDLQGNAVTFGNDYECFLIGDISQGRAEVQIDNLNIRNRGINLYFETSLLIRSRKTTAAGAAEVICIPIYELYR